MKEKINAAAKSCGVDLSSRVYDHTHPLNFPSTQHDRHNPFGSKHERIEGVAGITCEALRAISIIPMQTDHILSRSAQPTGSNLPTDLLRNISRYLSRSFSSPSAKRTMSSVAQRNNLFLLADQVLAFDVEGTLIEFGCHEGGTAQAIAMANDQHGNIRSFHVYDDFKYDPKETGSIQQKLIEGFEAASLPLPRIHVGDILGSLTDLPEKIAFAHIDLGFEEEPIQVKYMVQKCLEAIYPRMSPGAICVLMDYHDDIRTVGGWDCSPGVKMACDAFLIDKPEAINVLFGEEYSHAFFRKADVS